MVNSLTNMKRLLILLCSVALTVANNPKSPGPAAAAGTPCSQRVDLNWARQNAENMLFVEYMRRQAAANDFMGYRSQMDTDDYQSRLDEVRSMAECGMDNGGDPALNDRLGMLEERIISCGQTDSSYSNCGTSCNTNCEFYGQKINSFQIELRRQRLLIQRLYSQILVISQSKPECDRKMIFFTNFFFSV